MGRICLHIHVLNVLSGIIPVVAMVWGCGTMGLS